MQNEASRAIIMTGGMVGFRQTLERLMARRGYLQADLAEKAGLSQSQISKLLNGKREPKLSTLMALAKALGCSLDYLAGIDNPGPDELTQDERDLLDIYRRLHGERGEIALGILRTLEARK